MLVLDGLLVSLSTLLLELDFHAALGVLDDSRVDLDTGRVDGRVAAEGVLAGAELVDLVELEDVTDLDVADVRDGEEVAGSKNILFAYDIGDDVLGGLRANELESRGCCRRSRREGCWTVSTGITRWRLHAPRRKREAMGDETKFGRVCGS